MPRSPKGNPASRRRRATLVLLATVWGANQSSLAQTSVAAEKPTSEASPARVAPQSQPTSQPHVASRPRPTTSAGDAQEMVVAARAQVKEIGQVDLRLDSLAREARGKGQAIRASCIEGYRRDIQQKLTAAQLLLDAMERDAAASSAGTSSSTVLSSGYVTVLGLRPEIDELAQEAENCASSLVSQTDTTKLPRKRPTMPPRQIAPWPPPRPPLASPFRR